MGNLKRSSRRAILAFTVLMVCGVCWSGGLAQSGSNAATPAANTAVHSVTLSWKASVPASKSARDAVIGYIIYRGTKPHDPGAIPINSSQVVQTTYVDSKVEAGKTYFYFTRAVSASGKLSSPSNEVKAVVPKGTR